MGRFESFLIPTRSTRSYSSECRKVTAKTTPTYKRVEKELKWHWECWNRCLLDSLHFSIYLYIAISVYVFGYAWVCVIESFRKLEPEEHALRLLWLFYDVHVLNFYWTQKYRSVSSVHTYYIPWVSIREFCGEKEIELYVCVCICSMGVDEVGWKRWGVCMRAKKKGRNTYVPLCRYAKFRWIFQ